MAALAYYLVLYLYLHACTARLLLVSDKKSAAHLKFSSEVRDVETSDNNSSDRFSGHKDAINEGESTKGLHTSNILHQAKATAREIWKRSMLASNMEESVSSSKDDTEAEAGAEAVEDIVVMDYAQPHRKPPIHNKGT